MGIRAIDVSHYQGRIDWAAVKASGVQGVWINVGGADAGFYADPAAERNMQGAATVGLPYGTYYFCHIGNGTPERQAQEAVSCGLGRGILWPWADLEAGHTGGLADIDIDIWLGHFCDEVRRLTQRETVWYGGRNTGVGFTEHAPKCRVAISNYGANKPGTSPPYLTGPTSDGHGGPALPPAYSRWDVWQYNSETMVPGIPDNTCDQNVVTDDFWALMTQPDPKEQIMTKAIRVPEDDDDVWWHVVRDGGSELRRAPMNANDVIGLTFNGTLDGEADLKRGVSGFGINQSDIIDWLYALPLASSVPAPYLAQNTKDSAWAQAEAGLSKGAVATFLFQPGGIIKMLPDSVAAVYRVAGVPDVGEVDDARFQGGTLLPDAVKS